VKELRKLMESSTHTDEERDYVQKLDDYFTNGFGTNIEKLDNFAKYVPRQKIAYFLAKYEAFKKVLNIHGSIVECGVNYGGGLMAYAQFSAIFEPVNNQRKIIGFDTFSGFSKLTQKDKGSTSEFAKKGGFAVNTYDDILESIQLYDSNRFLNHMPKVELVKGDAVKTIPKYIKNNPHTLVSLLYLDFDVYEPTKVALENFVPRMPKGGVIVFDEINSKPFTGETVAVLDTMGVRDYKIERFTFDPDFAYVVLD
jgi:hypothetical protein